MTKICEGRRGSIFWSVRNNFSGGRGGCARPGRRPRRPRRAGRGRRGRAPPCVAHANTRQQNLSLATAGAARGRSAALRPPLVSLKVLNGSDHHLHGWECRREAKKSDELLGALWTRIVNNFAALLKHSRRGQGSLERYTGSYNHFRQSLVHFGRGLAKESHTPAFLRWAAITHGRCHATTSSRPRHQGRRTTKCT